MEEAFTKIYEKNRWGNGSGSGSNMSPDNKKYIEILESILKGITIQWCAGRACPAVECCHPFILEALQGVAVVRPHALFHLPVVVLDGSPSDRL